MVAHMAGHMGSRWDLLRRGSVQANTCQGPGVDGRTGSGRIWCGQERCGLRCVKEKEWPTAYDLGGSSADRATCGPARVTKPQRVFGRGPQVFDNLAPRSGSSVIARWWRGSMTASPHAPWRDPRDSTSSLQQRKVRFLAGNRLAATRPRWRKIEVVGGAVGVSSAG
jgi:hypothetical protein